MGKLTFIISHPVTIHTLTVGTWHLKGCVPPDAFTQLSLQAHSSPLIWAFFESRCQVYSQKMQSASSAWQMLRSRHVAVRIFSNFHSFTVHQLSYLTSCTRFPLFCINNPFFRFSHKTLKHTYILWLNNIAKLQMIIYITACDAI